MVSYWDGSSTAKLEICHVNNCNRGLASGFATPSWKACPTIYTHTVYSEKKLKEIFTHHGWQMHMTIMFLLIALNTLGFHWFNTLFWQETSSLDILLEPALLRSSAIVSSWCGTSLFLQGPLIEISCLDRFTTSDKLAQLSWCLDFIFHSEFNSHCPFHQPQWKLILND